MITLKRYLYTLLPVCLLWLMPSCVDDVIYPEPPASEDDWIDPNMPEEIRNGFSVSFNIALGKFGGMNTRTDNTELQEIDNYVDLERLRILFFVCAQDKDPENETQSKADTTHSLGRFGNRDLPYMIGKNDHFLFESKSRWVSQLEVDESTEALYQVTAPVFTYGNNDDYRWEDIRYALTNYPFKIVILANRPGMVEFGNFDDKFQGTVRQETGRGPFWGPSDTWIPRERRGLNPNYNDDLVNWDDKPIINDLHHCQWDVVYSSKNSGDKQKENADGTVTERVGQGVWSFIMKNPKPNKLINKGNDFFYVPQEGQDEAAGYEVSKSNLMGALSNWTDKEPDGVTYYHLPDKGEHSIPMYGCQVFDPITGWSSGSPFNVSNGHYNTSGTYIRKNINLLRSLVKVELRIPKKMRKNGKDYDIDVLTPFLCYSNVMARCEPLDVATPTERIWHEENWNLNPKPDLYCEWKNLYDRGPIVQRAKPADYDGTAPDFIHQQYAWFYGAWKEWWHFNYNQVDDAGNNIEYGLNPESSYFTAFPYEYPRIYNPCIQRNANGEISRCKVDREEDAYHYFVVYTGERNINDPTTFGTSTSFDGNKAELAYFKFTLQTSIDGKVEGTSNFCLPLTDYSTNTIVKDYYSNKTDMNNYREPMALGGQPNWNWPLLRNHVYTFTVRNLGTLSETGDWISVESVSSEKRTAPGFWFN